MVDVSIVTKTSQEAKWNRNRREGGRRSGTQDQVLSQADARNKKDKTSFQIQRLCDISQAFLLGQKYKLSISRPRWQKLRKWVHFSFWNFKIKLSYFYRFWPLGWDIDNFCIWAVKIFGWSHHKKVSVPGRSFIIFKLKNQHPSDIMYFLTETKS